MTRLRSERGGILVLAAVTLPVFLLVCALVVDAGNWFTHKRQLQNRADAGALAAGVEYLAQLANCQANPSGAGLAIADAAKRYAGDPDASVPGTKYNQEITNNNDLVVAINRTNVTDASDDSDGGNPCQPHTTGDAISPNADSLWTDVKVRESNIGTLFHAFGLNLPSITARARVQVKQVTGLSKGGLPFVHETGDYVDCAWAEFVDVRTGNKVSLVGSSNPIALTADPNVPRRWTADVNGINLPSGGERRRRQLLAGLSDQRQLRLLHRPEARAPGRQERRPRADRLDQRLRRRHAEVGRAAAPPPLLPHPRKLRPGPGRLPLLVIVVHHGFQRPSRPRSECDT